LGGVTGICSAGGATAGFGEPAFGGIAVGENDVQILRARLRCAKVLGGVELL